MPIQDNEFRYYRWRTLYGSKYWALDAGFYVLLGALHLQDVAQRERDKHELESYLQQHPAFVEEMCEEFMDLLTAPSLTEQANAGLIVIDDVTPPEQQAPPDEMAKELAEHIARRGGS